MSSIRIKAETVIARPLVMRAGGFRSGPQFAELDSIEA
jgi:hypothetical protein